MRRLLPFALILAGCSAQAGAAPETRPFTVTGFDRIAVAGPFDVAVRTGPGVSVRATGTTDALDRLVIIVENGQLRIRPTSFVGSSWSDTDLGKVKVTVTVPSLRAASLGGSGDLAIDRIKDDAFQAQLAGSGDMTIGAVQATSFVASVAGSGSLTAAGKAGTVKAAVAGSGSIAAAGLVSTDATISVTGSGDVSLAASHSAAVSSVGSGDVVVTGTAKCAVSQHGSGSVSCGRGS